LNILPSTNSQTGVLIGEPVAETSIHLFTQSIGFIAMVLTTPSPSCCCVSKTIFSPSGPFSSRASYIAGTFSDENFTSTTTQVILIIFPVLIFFL